jgi:hypothetical protein
MWTNGSSPESLTCNSGGNGLGLVALGGYFGGTYDCDTLYNVATKPKILRCPGEYGGGFFDDTSHPSWASYLYQSFYIQNGVSMLDKDDTIDKFTAADAMAMDAAQNWAASYQAPAHPATESTAVLYGDTHVEMKPWIKVDPSWPYGVSPFWFDERPSRGY